MNPILQPGVKSDRQTKEATLALEAANTLEQQSRNALEQTLQILIIAIPVVTAGLVLSSVRILNNIVRSMRKLINATEELAKGNYEAPLDIHAEDEIGTLASRFHEMRNELKNKERIKDEFLRMASHELRTPIQPILSYAELGRANKISKDIAFDEIVTHAKRLKRLTSDMLDVAKFDGGTIKYTVETIKINEVIAQAVSSAVATLRTNVKLSIQSDLKATEGLDLPADSDRIMQVVSNILNNSIKFTESGTVKVTTSMEKKTNEAAVEITDTGRGIPDDMLAHMFKKFVTTNDKVGDNQGTGLGLYFVAKIVEAHGGRVWARNNANGCGATIGFALPVRDKANKPMTVNTSRMVINPST